jgi:hypothetical protein
VPQLTDVFLTYRRIALAAVLGADGSEAEPADGRAQGTGERETDDGTVKAAKFRSDAQARERAPALLICLKAAKPWRAPV